MVCSCLGVPADRDGSLDQSLGGNPKLPPRHTYGGRSVGKLSD